MGQVTIYLDNETEQKLNAIIADLQVSKSKWIADLIRARTRETWPEAIQGLAGAWNDDFPIAEDIRKTMGQDTLRESL